MNFHYFAKNILFSFAAGKLSLSMQKTGILCKADRVVFFPRGRDKSKKMCYNIYKINYMGGICL